MLPMTTLKDDFLKSPLIVCFIFTSVKKLEHNGVAILELYLTNKNGDN